MKTTASTPSTRSVLRACSPTITQLTRNLLGLQSSAPLTKPTRGVGENRVLRHLAVGAVLRMCCYAEINIFARKRCTHTNCQVLCGHLNLLWIRINYRAAQAIALLEKGLLASHGSCCAGEKWYSSTANLLAPGKCLLAGLCFVSINKTKGYHMGAASMQSNSLPQRSCGRSL